MPIRHAARWLKRFLIYRVLSRDDPPHRIALGVALGVFVAWTPTMGLQMVLAVALAMLLDASWFVGVPFTWLSNPLTLVPVYGPAYLVGSWLLGGGYPWSRFMDRMGAAAAFGANPWNTLVVWLRETWPIAAPLWLGGVIVGGVMALAAYVLTYRGVLRFRKAGGTDREPPPRR